MHYMRAAFIYMYLLHCYILPIKTLSCIKSDSNITQHYLPNPQSQQKAPKQKACSLCIPLGGGGKLLSAAYCLVNRKIGKHSLKNGYELIKAF